MKSRFENNQIDHGSHAQTIDIFSSSQTSQQKRPQISTERKILNIPQTNDWAF